MKPDPVAKVTLSSTDLEASAKYWVDLLGMEVVSRVEGKSILMQYDANGAKLELVKVVLTCLGVLVQSVKKHGAAYLKWVDLRLRE